jgi:hypothetical protein
VLSIGTFLDKSFARLARRAERIVAAQIDNLEQVPVACEINAIEQLDVHTVGFEDVVLGLQVELRLVFG